MRLEFEVELPDAPGELSRVLETVAGRGGNVQAVIHRHELAHEGRVPVLLTVEVEEGQAITLLDALARKHRLLRVNREGGPASASLLLVGHVFEADLKELLDLGFDAGAEITSVDARVEGRANPSAVLVGLAAQDPAALDAACQQLAARAAEHDLLLIEQAEGDQDA